MANTVLADDLAKEVEPIEGTEDSVIALLLSIAKRIEAYAYGTGAQMTAYVKSLRDGSDEITDAILANSEDK